MILKIYFQKELSSDQELKPSKEETLDTDIIFTKNAFCFFPGQLELASACHLMPGKTVLNISSRPLEKTIIWYGNH